MIRGRGRYKGHAHGRGFRDMLRGGADIRDMLMVGAIGTCSGEGADIRDILNDSW